MVGDVVLYPSSLSSTDTVSLSKETAEQRRASVSPRIVTGPDPVSSLQQTLLAPSAPAIQPILNGSNDEMAPNGWSDLDHLLGYSGNVDFPYFPGASTATQPVAQANEPAFSQWNDLFSGFTSNNGWDIPLSSETTQETGMGDMWGGTGGAMESAEGNVQSGPEGRVNDFFHHIASALGG